MKIESTATEGDWSVVTHHTDSGFTICKHLSFQRDLGLFGKQWLDELVLDLFKVASSAFTVPESEAFYEDVREHVCSAEMLGVCYSGTQALGFLSVKDISELDTFFIHGIAVHSAYHKAGIGSILIDELLEHSSCQRIALTTQNPKMYCVLREKTSLTFPAPGSPIVRLKDRAYGEVLMRERSGSFDSKTFVSKNLYSRCLYPSISPSGDASVNEWFNTSLDIQKGQTRHGFLLCGER